MTINRRIILSAWQLANTPESLPMHVRENIVEGEGGCWLWARALDPEGYPRATFKYRSYRAHRLVYLLVVGEIADGLTLDHLCRVRHCVNPDHLEPVTIKENLLRSDRTATGMKRCKRGHEFTWDGKRRRCRQCAVLRGDLRVA